MNHLIGAGVFGLIAICVFIIINIAGDDISDRAGLWLHGAFDACVAMSLGNILVAAWGA